MPGAYLRIHAEHVTHTLAHTNSKARYTSDTGDYRVITRRFDYGLPPRIRRLSAGRSPPTLGRDCCEPPSWRTTPCTRPCTRLRGGHTCVCVSRPISTSAGVACNPAENKGWIAPHTRYVHGYSGPRDTP